MNRLTGRGICAEKALYIKKVERTMIRKVIDRAGLLDGLLERRIELARNAFSRSGKQEDWDKLRRLINKRSPNQIDRMEKAMKLK